MRMTNVKFTISKPCKRSTSFVSTASSIKYCFNYKTTAASIVRSHRWPILPVNLRSPIDSSISKYWDALRCSVAPPGHPQINMKNPRTDIAYLSSRECSWEFQSSFQPQVCHDTCCSSWYLCTVEIRAIYPYLHLTLKPTCCKTTQG